MARIVIGTCTAMMNRQAHKASEYYGMRCRERAAAFAGFLNLPGGTSVAREIAVDCLDAQKVPDNFLCEISL